MPALPPSGEASTARSLEKPAMPALPPSGEDSDASECEGDDGGAGSSSSRSPEKGTRPDQSSGPWRRFRRQSSGLIVNHGSATVECVRRSKAECRFSFSSQVGGQMLTPVREACQEPVRSVRLDSPAPETAGELFARFVTADNIMLAQHAFVQLLQRCGGSLADARAEPPRRRIQRLCSEGLPWRARNLWSLLDTRASRPEYTAAPLAKTRAVVCGAGPCGLRVALELALLHGDVCVVEKRAPADAFGRVNRVHLWEWCKQDLLAWGAKIFDPPGGTFGGDNDFCHIGIGELQLLLAKNALLLGVDLRFGVEAREVGSKALLCRDGTRLPCDAVVLADGASSPLSRAFGLRSVALGLRGKGSAIGVVANFVNSRDPQQMALRQFSWARQFNVPLFAQLEEQTAINLENVVYYKGPALHYMVMTPTKRSLLDVGVLRDGRGTGRGLLHGSNVDIEQLSAMVKRIAVFFGLPTELCESQGAMIFDFSGVKRLENAAVTMGGIFACAVGDALLEPFWPEGLGIMRGFMSALDAAAAVATAAGGRTEEALAQMAATYNILKSVAAQTASQCLQKDLRQYRLQPKSRYIFSQL